ncbi:hypothetical protein D9M71_468240 [compost metagenome]
MVDVAGQQHLLGVDPATAGDHRRAVAVDDVLHFGMLEDQRAQAGGGLGFADAQVERVQVHVAGVLDGADVEVGGQVLAHAGGVQQGHFVAHASAHRFFIGSLQLVHVRGLHRRMQVAALEVAVDAIARHTLLDHLVPAPAQVPDEIVDLGTQAVAHLRAHGFVARQAAGDLAAIAPAGAPADAVGFDDGHLQATLGQFHGAGHAGEAAADDGHIHLHRALELRVLGVVVEGGAVIGRRALRRAFVQCCVHGCSLFCRGLRPGAGTSASPVR